MRNKNFIIIFLLVLSILFTACTKQTENKDQVSYSEHVDDKAVSEENISEKESNAVNESSKNNIKEGKEEDNTVEKESQDKKIITEIIESFESESTVSYKLNNCDAEIVSTGATEGNNAMKINFKPANYPGISFTPEEPWDWSNDMMLAFDVTNPTDEKLRLSVKVNSKNSDDDSLLSRSGYVDIMRGKTETIVMSFGPTPEELGMRSIPQDPVIGKHISGNWGDKNIDLSNIVGVSLFMINVKQPKTLIFDNIRLVSDTHVVDNIVDKYGQYTGEDWPEKIKEDEDLLRQKEEEEKELISPGSVPNRSIYGGWLNGPKLEGTGFFRTEKHNGKWWLVDPEGYLFFSTGIDIIRFSDSNTKISGRENMFSWLPKYGEPLSKHYTFNSNYTAYNFYTANLERKYGENYFEIWKDITLKRFATWGFTSIGNWSDPSFWNGEETKMPYVAHGWIRGDHLRVDSGSVPGQLMHDPYDPNFVTSTRNMAKNVSEEVENDPWCIGIFVDNELYWGTLDNDKSHYKLIINVFNFEAERSPAKRAFIEKLKDKYGNIANLNKSWNTKFESWEELERPFDVVKHAGEKFPEEIKEDFSNLLKALALQYYSVVKNELDAVLPNHLYLGSRLTIWGMLPEVAEAAGEVCDVVSFNSYTEILDEETWSFLKPIDKPCIIGEFNFGVYGRGMTGSGGFIPESQEERGNLYQNYVRSALENPYFVGCHWFQYMDQPITGRAWDGEDYNCGFVSITDTPYKELIDAAKEINMQVYEIRYSTAE